MKKHRIRLSLTVRMTQVAVDYRPLWDYVRNSAEFPLKLSFMEIQQIIGCPLQHSFLAEKKKLLAYGYSVEKISLKEKYVVFNVCN